MPRLVAALLELLQVRVLRLQGVLLLLQFEQLRLHVRLLRVHDLLDAVRVRALGAVALRLGRLQLDPHGLQRPLDLVQLPARVE